MDLKRRNFFMVSGLSFKDDAYFLTFTGSGFNDQGCLTALYEYHFIFMRLLSNYTNQQFEFNMNSENLIIRYLIKYQLIPPIDQNLQL